MRPAHLVFALVTALTVSSSGSVFAQTDADRATARALFFQAQEALDKKDFASAADLFGRSDALAHAPTAALGFARAQMGLGRLVGAYETLNRLVREGLPPAPSAAFAKAFEDARRELAALETRLPSVVITVSGASDPVVTVDGAPVNTAALGVNRFIDPGTHVVAASAAGFLSTETRFSVDEGGTAKAAVVLQRDPKYPPLGGGAALAAGTSSRKASGEAPAPRRETDANRVGGSTRRTVGFAVGGVGLAGLALAGAGGVVYLSHKGTAEEHCTAAKQCDVEGLDAVSAARAWGVVNTVALVGGVAAVGVGAYLVVSSGGERAARRSTAIGPSVSPGGVLLSVRRTLP